MKILFWNLNGNNIKEYIKQCLVENEVDIAVFAEHKGVNFISLEHEMLHSYRHIEGMGGCDKIAIFAARPATVLIKQEQSRYVLYTVDFDRKKYVIASVHLQDRRSSDSAIRIETIGRLMNDVKNLEQSSKCNNTIIIGDFNANPYDEELLQMNAFHAVLFKEIIRKSETRTIDNRAYRRLYNPTIHFLSEDTQNYGSYYYQNGSCTPVWHCLDQILVSKALIDNIKSLQYIRNIGDKSLINRIAPNRNISDHLPLYVRFD